jgi:hypothetical protein
LQRLVLGAAVLVLLLLLGDAEDGGVVAMVLVASGVVRAVVDLAGKRVEGVRGPRSRACAMRSQIARQGLGGSRVEVGDPQGGTARP